MSAITAKASRKMKKYAVLTREPRCFLGSFDFSWEQRKAKELFVSTADKGYPELPVLSATQDRGMIRRDENSINIFHDKKNEAGYKRVLPGQFVIHLRSFQGGFAHSAIEGITSPAYTVFGFSEPEKHDSEYWKYVFTSKSFIQRLETVTYGIRDGRSISYEEFLTLGFVYPSKAEQTAIARYLDKLSDLITLHQRKCVFLFGFFQAFISMIFTASTFSWEQRKLGELVDRVVRKNTNNESTLPLTISAQYGLVDQITYFNNRVASRDVSNYYLVLNGEFAYNKSTSDGYPFGAVKRLDLYEKGVLSTLYIVFAPKKEQQIDSDYLTVFFDTDRWHKGVAERAAEGARNHGLLNISAEDFFDIDLSVPKDIVEQKQIGAFIRQLDNLITLHQRECISFTARAGRRILTANKKRNTSSWEQRKVGDLLIERNQQAPMSDEYPLMAFIANEGVAPKGERYDRSALVTDTVNKLYKKTEKGDFIYSSNNLETGSIGLNKYGKACISPVYSIFEPTGIADSDFLGRRLVRKDFINAMVKWRQGVIYGQWRIHESDFLKIEITVPSVEEQRKIGAYLDQLDNLITLHQRKPFLMKWRTSDANRNKTNRLVL